VKGPNRRIDGRGLGDFFIPQHATPTIYQLLIISHALARRVVRPSVQSFRAIIDALPDFILLECA
jgi:hypothetical protein